MRLDSSIFDKSPKIWIWKYILLISVQDSTRLYKSLPDFSIIAERYPYNAYNVHLQE